MSLLFTNADGSVCLDCVDLHAYAT